MTAGESPEWGYLQKVCVQKGFGMKEGQLGTQWGREINDGYVCGEFTFNRVIVEKSGLRNLIIRDIEVISNE